MDDNAFIPTFPSQNTSIQSLKIVIKGMFSRMRIIAIALITLLLTACGSSRSSDSSFNSSTTSSSSSTTATTEAPLAITNLRLSVSGEDEFEFRWNDADSATYYNLWESIDGIADGTLVGAGIDPSRQGYDDPYYYKTTIADRLNAQYLIQSCNNIGCAASAPILVSDFYVPVEPFKLTFSQTKSFDFTWPAKDGATHYKLMENTDGNSGFSQVGENIANGTLTYSHIVPLYNRMNAQYILQSCTDITCTDSEIISVNDNLASSVGYLKASNTSSNDRFGSHLAISADGKTLAVAANLESSSSTGINGAQVNDDSYSAGAVYIFTVDSTNSWSQQAYIKASNAEASDLFGYDLSLSSDGNTLAVSALEEDSNATGINGDQSNNDKSASGAVYVYTRNSENTWSQQAYVKASNTDSYDQFGYSVALSLDGNTLAVGAIEENSKATGINGDQTSNNGWSGAVYVFTRNSTAWTQQAYIKPASPSFRAFFGSSLALSLNGNTLVVGAYGEESNAIGINGDATDFSAMETGAVYVFTRNTEAEWAQQAYIKSSNSEIFDQFGKTVALSSNGDTLAVGAYKEKSTATGINGDQTNNDAFFAGAVYLFTRDDSNIWSQGAYIKASNTEEGDGFSQSIALSSDGKTLAVSAFSEGSNAIGINGNQNTNRGGYTGAVYLFSKNISNTWRQKAYIKASNTGQLDRFGISLSLSSNGEILAVGASGESSNVFGVNGDQTNNDAFRSGAVYLY